MKAKRYMVWVAFGLSCSYMLVTLCFRHTDFGAALVTALVLHVPAGRWTAIGASLALGVGYWPTLWANVYFCFAELAVLLALIEHGEPFLRRHPWLRARIESLEARAEQHRASIERWGLPGLALLVSVPLVFTGPWVGLALGHVMRLRPWRVLVAVGLGSAISMAFLGGILEGGGHLYVNYRPPAWTLLLAVPALLGYLYVCRRRRRRDGLAAEATNGA